MDTTGGEPDHSSWTGQHPGSSAYSMGRLSQTSNLAASSSGSGASPGGFDPVYPILITPRCPVEPPADRDVGQRWVHILAAEDGLLIVYLIRADDPINPKRPVRPSLPDLAPHGLNEGILLLVTFPVHQVVEYEGDLLVLGGPGVRRNRPVLLDQPVESSAEVVFRRFEGRASSGQETSEFVPQGLDRDARGFRDDAQGDGTAGDRPPSPGRGPHPAPGSCHPAGIPQAPPMPWMD